MTWHPLDIAIDYFGNQISYEELMRQVDMAARGFKALGIQRGDVISICSANIPEAIYAIYAANKIGAVANIFHPLSANIFHPLSASAEIEHAINLTDSKYLVAIDVSWGAIRPILDKVNLNQVIILSPTASLPFVSRTSMKIASFIPLLHKKQERPHGNNVIPTATTLCCGRNC